MIPRYRGPVALARLAMMRVWPPRLLAMVPMLTVLLLAACDDAAMPTMPALTDGPDPMRPGVYPVSMTVEVLGTAEEVAARCNYGIPPKNGDLGCVFPRANPPLVIVPALQGANDWHSQCVWGHEMVHIVYGAFHAAPVTATSP